MDTFNRINYRDASVYWRVIKTKRNDGNTTSKLQASLKFTQQVGIDIDGKPITKRRSKSKVLGSPYALNTKAKRKNAVNKWIDELEEEQTRQQELWIRQREEMLKAEEDEVEVDELEQTDRDADDALGGRSPVGVYVTNYIDDAEAMGSIEKTTIRKYRQLAKHIDRGFREIRMDELTPAMVQKWESSELRAGRSASAVLKDHRLLSLVCKHAVFFGDLERNPCVGVKPPKQKAPQPNSLTADGFPRLASLLELNEPNPVVVAAFISLFTGMREGEVCGLRWREYDPEAGTIRVVEAIATAKGGSYSKPPKTTSSRRIVPVSPRLATMLERRRNLMLGELKSIGKRLRKEEFGRLYVIGSIDGRFYCPNVLSKDWRVLSGSLGLVGTRGRHITFHDLRHSFATRAIAAGADVKAVSSVLGHANASMTLNVYADADPDAKRRATNLVELAAAQNKTEDRSKPRPMALQAG